MSQSKSLVIDNPFSAARLRPGRLPFLFADANSTHSLLDRWQAIGRRGSIVGPHGSGKSTLLYAMRAELESTGMIVRAIELHNHERRLPGGWRDALPKDPRVVIMIDGYEQLSHVARCGLRFHCWRNHWGLLVTSHRAIGLPLLYETDVTPALMRQVVERLEPGFLARETGEIDELWAKHGGNAREILFDLYDRFEVRKRSNSAHCGF